MEEDFTEYERNPALADFTDDQLLDELTARKLISSMEQIIEEGLEYATESQLISELDDRFSTLPLEKTVEMGLRNATNEQIEHHCRIRFIPVLTPDLNEALVKAYQFCGWHLTVADQMKLVRDNRTLEGMYAMAMRRASFRWRLPRQRVGYSIADCQQLLEATALSNGYDIKVAPGTLTGIYHRFIKERGSTKTGPPPEGDAISMSFEEANEFLDFAAWELNRNKNKSRKKKDANLTKFAEIP